MHSSKSFRFLRQGKVRDVYASGDGEHLLIVASDRISAFDHVLPNTIADKGKILTSLSNFWFERTGHIIANHIVSTQPSFEHWEDDERWSLKQLACRSILVKKADPLPIEAIVRGYLAGSGWKEYLQTGCVCGISLPQGLREGDKLPQPIFTPSTKAAIGAHDENITFSEAEALAGSEIAIKVRDVSLQLYAFAEDHARQRGIIIADTKFEFGMIGGDLILIDEIFTPDSSRFWPSATYQSGASPISFDKQFVRDYLEKTHWNKQPPAPALPADIVSKTQAKYQEALQRLTDNPKEAKT